MSELLDHALQYAEMGWAVFPVAPDRKIPITPRGHLDATSNPAQITAWWTAEPTARIGVHLRESGLIAIDVDPRNGGSETLASLERNHGALPRTNHQRSASGGEHFVMLDPSPGDDGWTRRQEDGGACRGKLGPGVDVKCNGYIVVEPSDGYTWIAFGAQEGAIDDVPEVWRAVLRKTEPAVAERAHVEGWSTSTHELTERAANQLRAALTGLGPRGAGKSTTCAAIKLVHHAFGLSLADGRPFLDAWNAQCGEPHDPGELERQIERVAALSDEKPRGWCARAALTCERIVDAARATTRGTWAHELVQALEEVHAALGSGASDRPSRAPMFMDATDLFVAEFPSTPWLVSGLVTDGGIATIGGEPKTCKTWLATEIAVAVATGTPACGEFAARRGTVAYFFAEDLAKQVRNRVRALLAGRGVELPAAAGRLHVCPRGKFLDVTRTEDLAWIVASCRRLGAVDLLVLDPLRDISTAAEDKSDEMGVVMRHLRLLGELLACTVAIVHHAAKASGDTRGRRPGQRLRGSGAIHGSTDSGIYLGDLDGDGTCAFTNTVDSEVKGARSAGRFNLALTIADDDQGEAVHATWAISRGERKEPASKPGSLRDGKDDELVLSAIRAAGARKEYRTTRAWRTLVPTLAEKRVTDSVKRLITRGVLETRDYHPSTAQRAPGSGVYVVPRESAT